jgi:hypothetical protein
MEKRVVSRLALVRTATIGAILLVALMLLILLFMLAACSTTKTPLLKSAQSSGSTQPMELSAFSISGFTINPTKVNTGDSVSIIADVTNGGTKPGTYDALLMIDNTVVISKAVAIPAGATQRLNIVIPTDKPGTYEAELGGFKGTFTVVDNNGNPAKVIPQSEAGSAINPTSADTAVPSCCSPSQTTPDVFNVGGLGSPSPLAPSSSTYQAPPTGDSCCGK